MSCKGKCFFTLMYGEALEELSLMVEEGEGLPLMWKEGEGLPLMGEEVWEGPGMMISSSRYTPSSRSPCSSSTSSRGKVWPHSSGDGVGRPAADDGPAPSSTSVDDTKHSHVGGPTHLLHVPLYPLTCYTPDRG